MKIASHRAAKPILHLGNYCGLEPHGDFIVEEPVPEAIYIIDDDGKLQLARRVHSTLDSRESDTNANLISRNK